MDSFVNCSRIDLFVCEQGSGVDSALNLKTDDETVYLFSTTTQDTSADKEWLGTLT